MNVVQWNEMDLIGSVGIKRSKMKFCLCFVAVSMAAASYGWGLGDALKAVDKATTTVNDANNAVKAVTQQPQQMTTDSATAADATADAKDAATTQAALASPSVASTSAASSSSAPASTLKWDAAGYAAKLAKVNDAMPKVTPKMPLRGEPEQWYNAAYQLTSIDKQYSFLPPAQRVTRISPNTQAGVDKFLAWVDGGMQTVTAANQPPFNSPATPSGYNQQPSCANAPRTKPAAETANAGNPPPTGAPAVPAGYDRQPSYAMTAATRTQNCNDRAKMQAEEDAKGSSKANTERQEKMAEMKNLVAKFDAVAVNYTSDVAVCKKVFSSVTQKYAKYIRPDEASSYKCMLDGALVNEPIAKFLKNKADGKYSKEMDIPDLNNVIYQLKSDLDYASKNTENTHVKCKVSEKGSVAYVDELSSVSSPALKAKVTGIVGMVMKIVTDSLKNQINNETDGLLQSNEITVEFRDKVWQDRDAANGSPEKLMAVLQEIKDELDNKKKLVAEREALIKQLAASDVAAWWPEIEKYPKGEGRNALVGDVLAAKFGTGADYGKDAQAVADLIGKLYTTEQQRELLDSNKASISIVIAIVSSIQDAELRKKLLLDNTDWAFHTYRKSSEEENQSAYLALLSKEKDMNVLMSVYEKSDNINFTYEENAKTGEPQTYGDALEKMWKDNRNNKGYGYGRLGLWMLDHCGKGFGDLVQNRTEARRAAAKNQTFLMKDFYLGMPKRDFKLIAKNWDEKMGRVTAQFGAFNNRTISEVRFGAKARSEYLGIKKDGLEGLEKFVDKYIPGGMKEAGEPKVYAEVENERDPENPNFTVKSWWYVNCPKYDCRIRMFDSGTISILYVGDDDSPTLDFSSVK